MPLKTVSSPDTGLMQSVLLSFFTTSLLWFSHGKKIEFLSLEVQQQRIRKRTPTGKKSKEEMRGLHKDLLRRQRKVKETHVCLFQAKSFRTWTKTEKNPCLSCEKSYRLLLILQVLPSVHFWYDIIRVQRKEEFNTRAIPMMAEKRVNYSRERKLKTSKRPSSSSFLGRKRMTSEKSVR